MSRLLRATLFCSCMVPFGLTGCSHAMCDPNPVGESWKPYDSLLPVDAVICGPNRISSKKPANAADNNGPEQVFVFYRDADVPTAFERTIRRFEVAGWRVVARKIYEEGASGLYSATVAKGDLEVAIMVNKNDWGIQGSFNLRESRSKTS